MFDRFYVIFSDACLFMKEQVLVLSCSPHDFVLRCGSKGFGEIDCDEYIN